MPFCSSPNLRKRKLIHKTQLHCSSTKLATSNQNVIANNFYAFLRHVAHPQQPRPTNPLISFLNLASSKKETSLHYIPSIENLISQQQIEEENQMASISSIERGFSDEVISEHNYELRVLYVCMLQKIMKRLQYHTSESQRRKIIRGAWNILIKYWKDHNYFIFTNIGTQIEWGLLELINFNFHFTFKEKCQAELLLQADNQNPSIHSLANI